MATRPKPDFLEILKTLREHRVDFIVVGGVCAVLHGAPVSTFDLDLVHSRAEDNIERLLGVLEKLQARYRTSSAKTLRPARSHLSSAGHQLLMTCFGPLDLLGEIGAAHGYDELVRQTVEVEVRGPDAPSLLVNWLSEILYWHDAEGWLFGKFEIHNLSDRSLTARARGEKFDPARHQAKLLVKAITYHQLALEQMAEGWRAQVYVDI